MSGPQEPNEPENKKPSVQDRLSGKMDELKKNENVRQVMDFAKSNTSDTIGLAALVVGVLALFFSEFWGGVILGAVAGFYFADPIINFVKGFKDQLESIGMVRTVILVGIGLGFLIAFPAFVLGCAAAAGIKYILGQS
jgi:hypothetical protein